MAGDPANASIWPDANVYVAALGSTIPADEDTAFNGSWDLVGLLDGDEGFAHDRSESVTDHFAWGGILVRTSRKDFKYEVKFTPLEWNDTVRDLVFPNSPAGTIIVPRPVRILIAFETIEDTVVRRLISKYQAEVSVDGTITDQEDDLTKYPLKATIFPNAAGELFTEQPTNLGS